MALEFIQTKPAIFILLIPSKSAMPWLNPIHVCSDVPFQYFLVMKGRCWSSVLSQEKYSGNAEEKSSLLLDSGYPGNVCTIGHHDVQVQTSVPEICPSIFVQVLCI